MRRLARIQDELSRIGWTAPAAEVFDGDAWDHMVGENLLLGGLEAACFREGREPQTVEAVCDEAHRALEQPTTSRERTATRP